MQLELWSRRRVNDSQLEGQRIDSHVRQFFYHILDGRIRKTSQLAQSRGLLLHPMTMTEKSIMVGVRYVCIGYLTEMYEMKTHGDTYEMPVGFY